MRRSVFGLAVSLGMMFFHTGGAVADAGLNVVGTGDGLEMLREIGEGFTGQHPEIELSIPPSIGSGGGTRVS